MEKLLRVLEAEVAMEKAYAALSATERQAYIEINRKSRFAERAAAPSSPQSRRARRVHAILSEAGMQHVSTSGHPGEAIHRFRHAGAMSNDQHRHLHSRLTRLGYSHSQEGNGRHTYTYPEGEGGMVTFNHRRNGSTAIHTE